MTDFVNDVVDTKSDPSHVSVSAIVGVPADLVVLDPGASDLQDREAFDAILDDPRMEFRFSAEGRLLPACETPGLGSAYPARRIVEFVRGVDELGARGLVQSICQGDWSDVMEGISRVIPCP